MLEIDSFYVKFKNLLLSGKDANLNVKAEAGKASVQLTVEVDVSPHTLFTPNARNSSSKRRRRERRAAARVEAEEAATHDVADKAADKVTPGSVEEEAEKVSTDEDVKHEEKLSEEDVISSIETAEEAPTIGAALVCNPLNEVKNQDTEDRNVVRIISVIPMTNFNLSDIAIQEAIKNKIEAKNFNVKEIEVHRSAVGNFVRSDVMIEVVPGHLVKNINFEFQNCQVIPCFQPG